MDDIDIAQIEKTIDRSYVPFFLEQVATTDGNKRIQAIEHLAKIGDYRTVETLHTLLESTQESKKIRQAAYNALRWSEELYPSDTRTSGLMNMLTFL